MALERPRASNSALATSSVFEMRSVAGLLGECSTSLSPSFRDCARARNGQHCGTRQRPNAVLAGTAERCLRPARKRYDGSALMLRAAIVLLFYASAHRPMQASASRW